jgi:penicillin amidase
VAASRPGDEQVLEALRRRGRWDEVAAALSCTEAEARKAAMELLRGCLPPAGGRLPAAPYRVRIRRDEWGVPLIEGESEEAALFGLGLAMGQDRLWQLDFLRRWGEGTQAEVLGPAMLPQDRLARTLNFAGTAARGAALLAGPARRLLEAFVAGVNLAREQALECGLPFEFRLLEYQPEPWSLEATLVVQRAFWWQLTGRFPILCLPEAALRLLGPGPRWEALFSVETTGEVERTIWPPELPVPRGPAAGTGGSGRGPAEPDLPGSNNWAVAGTRSASGTALLAGDPHLPLGAPSVWYEAALRGGALDVAGAMPAGIPAVLYGRNPHAAWAITNNISSLRDLYVEVTEDFDPLRYRRGAGWHTMAEREEVIPVRGGSPERLVVREVDHGPVVSSLLPDYAPRDEVVSLRWVGSEPTPELEAAFALMQARSVPALRDALREWACPTFNFVLADDTGSVGYQLTGRIPLRKAPARGYRPGDDPDHAWQGYVPFAGLPACTNPPAGWVGSANNRVAPDDWPYPLSGTWPSDLRMRRMADVLGAGRPLDLAAMAALQLDVLSLRGASLRDAAVAALREAGVRDPLLAELAEWDGTHPVESRPALVFEAFYLEWSRAVYAARLPPRMHAPLLVNSAGLVRRLLHQDDLEWFPGPGARPAALRSAWAAGRALLGRLLGEDRSAWRWGALHTLTLAHPAAVTPVLADLLNRGPTAHPGTWNCLNNSLHELDTPFSTVSGVSYRYVTDLGGEARAVNCGGQSGHPGSPHYADQVPLWAAGQYRTLPPAPPAEAAEWLLGPP